MDDAPTPTAAVLAIEGEMTIYRASELRGALLQALEQGAGLDLELDLSAVSELDSAGVQLLVAAARSAREAGGELRLRSASAAVQEALAFLGLQGFGAAA